MTNDREHLTGSLDPGELVKQELVEGQHPLVKQELCPTIKQELSDTLMMSEAEIKQESMPSLSFADSLHAFHSELKDDQATVPITDVKQRETGAVKQEAIQCKQECDSN